MGLYGEATLLATMTFCLAIIYQIRGSVVPPLLVAAWLIVDATFFLILRFIGWDEDLRLFTAQSWMDYTGTGWKATVAVVAMVIVLIAGTLWRPRRLVGRPVSKVTVVDRSLQEAVFRDNAMVTLVGSVLAGTIFVFEIIHFALIDKSLLWRNSTYLLLRYPEAHGLTTNVESFVFFLLRPTGLICGVLASVFLANGRYLLGVWFLLLSVYPFLYDFAQNSRFAPFMLFILGFLMISSGKRWLLSVGYGSIVLAFMTLVKVLVMRNSPFQGLAGTVDFLKELHRRDLSTVHIIMGLGLNIFQTTHTVANALVLGGDYSIAYKLASFSPLPSVLDGGGELTRREMLRVNPFVPYNALAEAILFGPGWLIVFYAGAALWSAWATRRWESRNTLARAGVLISLLGVVQCLQYPLRNTVRYFLIAYAFDAVIRSMAVARGERRSVAAGATTVPNKRV